MLSNLSEPDNSNIFRQHSIKQGAVAIAIIPSQLTHSQRKHIAQGRYTLVSTTTTGVTTKLLVGY